MRLKLLVSTFVVAALLLVSSPFLFGGAKPVAAQSGCGPGVTHTVSYGQTMFRIALRYGTTVSAITNANMIGNPNLIYAGQVLQIPCAGGSSAPGVPPGLSSPPVPTAIPLYGVSFPNSATVLGGNPVFPQAAALDCTSFRATSPTDGFGASTSTLYWNPAPGAQAYRINIYNLDGGGYLAQTWDVGPTWTRMTTDTSPGIIGGGYRFSWNVEALANGQPVCRTQTVTVWRAVATDIPATPTP